MQPNGNFSNSNKLILNELNEMKGKMNTMFENQKYSLDKLKEKNR